MIIYFYFCVCIKLNFLHVKNWGVSLDEHKVHHIICVISEENFLDVKSLNGEV